MHTFRRFLALSLCLPFGLALLAQTAPTQPAREEKLTLQDAIERALSRNFAIKVQGFDASIAAARVTESLGKFDPVLNSRYTYAESSNPALIDVTTGLRPSPIFDQSDSSGLSVDGLLPWGMTYQLGATQANNRSTANAYGDNFATFAGISGTQPLLRNFGFTPTLATIRIAQANRGISQWQYRQAVIDTVTNVIIAYNNLNFYYANLRSAIRSRDLAADLLAENQKRFAVGSMSEYDVTSARSKAATREEGILLAQRLVREGENALKQLISDNKTADLLNVHLTVEPNAPAPVVVIDPAADFHVALEKRPDYQSARLALTRNDINTRLQRNQLLPRVDLTGSYGYNGYDANQADSRRQVREQDYHAYSYGVVVSIPLTFTTERGRYRAAKLQQRQSETDLERLEQDIVVQIGNAADHIETAKKRVQVTRVARELAQATLDAEVKRLRAGQSSTFFVSQQQETLSFAEVREADALTDYASALADYDRQLGVTLEKRNITVDPPT